MQYLNIIKIVPGLQATSLVARSIPKRIPMKPYKKIHPNEMFYPKRKIKNDYSFPSKNLIKGGIGALVGIGLIAATVSVIKDI